MKKLSLFLLLFTSAGCIEFEQTGTDSATEGEYYSDEIEVTKILPLTHYCTQLEKTSQFKTDEGSAYLWNIPICKLNGALWWRADADIDYDTNTSAKDSFGNPLNSENIPYFTIPYPSNGFYAPDYNLIAGKDSRASVGILIYEDKFIYAVFGNYNGNGIIGDISQKAAEMLQIPLQGVNSGVTYIVFTEETYAFPIENYENVKMLGELLTKKLIENNTKPESK